MSQEKLLMGLGAAMLVIAAVVLTIIIEQISYRRRQEKENDLHDRMGLNTKEAETPESK